MTLNLIESRIYNPPAQKLLKPNRKMLQFVNKGMDMTNINKIINNENLPTQSNKPEQISTVYTLTKTIDLRYLSIKNL